MKRHLCFLLCLSLASIVPASALQGPKNLAQAQRWVLQSAAQNALLQPLPGLSLKNGSGWEVHVLQPSTPFYAIMVVQTIAPAIPKNDRLRLSFYARSPTGNPLRAAIEQTGAPYTSVLQETVLLTPGWKHYVLSGSTAFAYGPAGVTARFQMGQQKGTVDVAHISVTDLGIDPSFIAAEEAVQPAAEQARIWKYRMANLTVLAVNAQGHPLPNIHVHVEMTRPAFLFGCNLFGLQFGDHSPAQTAYRQRFAALFNYATLPFYWGAFEPQEGHPQYARLDQILIWAIAHQITPKGHPLVWHEVWPSWAPSTSDATIPLLHRRVTDLITHYKGAIHYWDVVNEANSADPKTGEGAWIQRDGAAKVVATALGWARAAGKGSRETFLYNDYDTGSDNIALLAQLQKWHALPDAIGIQSHMFSEVWPMTQLWQICQQFSRFGIPIHFTETTILSGPIRPNLDYNTTYTNWHTTPADEAAQAAYAVKYYTLLFSVPALRAITWWDLSDKDSWLGAPSGLLRADMTPKPAYNQLMTLIHKTWWTSAQGITAKNGRYAVHAFYGDYTITANGHGHTISKRISWSEDTGSKQITMVIP